MSMASSYRIPSYRLQLVRDAGPECERRAITTPEAGAALLRAYLGDPDREHFVVLMLDKKNRPIGLHTVSIGQIDSGLVRAADVFKAALLANARAVILCHNHPSGDTTPSRDDASITRGLADAGKLLDVDVLDHLILGEGEEYRSLKRNGLME